MDEIPFYTALGFVISINSILIPVFVIFLRFGKIDIRLLPIVCLVLFLCVFEYYSMYLSPNFILFNIYTYVEYALLTWYFIQFIAIKWVKYVMILVSIGFYALSVLFLKYEPFGVYNGLQRTLENSIELVLILYVLWELFHYEKEDNLKNFWHFWVFGSYLIYFAGIFFMTIIKSYAHRLGFTFSVSNVHSIINTLLNITLAFVLWKQSKKEI